MTRTSPRGEEEVGPIVFRPKSPAPSLTDPVDHITFPPEPAPAEVATPSAPPAPAVRQAKATVPGLVLGLVAGVATGAAVGLLALHRLELRERAAPPQPSPSGVLAQALTMRPGPAAIPAPPATIPAEQPISAEKPQAKREDGFDLDRLARAIAAAPAPPSGDAANVAPVQPPPIIETAPQQTPRRATPEPAPPILAPPVIIARPAAPPPPVKAAPPPAPRWDADVAQAEQRLGLAYDRAMASAPDRAALHAEQERWRQQRARLADKEAVLAFYQARIDELTEQDRIERRRGGIGRLLRD